MDLCFQNYRAAQASGDVIDFVTIGRNFPAGYWYPELRTNFLSLIFVYLHVLSARWTDNRQKKLTMGRFGKSCFACAKAGILFHGLAAGNQKHNASATRRCKRLFSAFSREKP